MKLKNRVLAGLIAAAALGVGLSTAAVAPANATTAYPEGGTWQYGHSFSNYHHPSKLHRSTTCTSTGCTRSADARGGSWSYSSRQVTLYGNQAYYYVY